MSTAATASTGDGGTGSNESGTVLDRLRSAERVLWLVVATSLLLDFVLTYYGLASGLSEGNPVMAGAIERWGIQALVLAKVAVVAVALGLRALRPRLGPFLSLGIAVPWGSAVTINASLLILV